MKFRVLKLFILVFVVCSANAKRYSSGSRSRGSSSSSHHVSRPSVSRPSSNPPTSFSSSSNFLHAESGRPSRPASHSSAPVRTQPTYHQTHSSAPSAPYPTNTHHAPSAPSYAKPVQDHHQQSSAPVSHSDPYSRQPAQNPHVSNAPYVPSGGYGSHVNNIPPAPNGISVPSISNHPAPYPTHLPNHPHPNPSISSSSYPTNSHPPPFSPHPSIHPLSYPNTHNLFNPGPPPAYGSPNYVQPSYGSYHPPAYSPHAPAYHAPPAYQPASQPFVPGRTVYVIPESSHKSNSGPGIGSIIAGGVAGGVAAGATNAIVDHAISSIFRPSSNHVHTYPSAPPVGTPTSSVTHTTNNYYYGSSGPGDSSGNNAAPPQSNPTNNPGTPVNGQPPQAAPQPDANVTPVNNAGNQANPGASNVAVDSRGNPLPSTNGAVSKSPEGQPPNPDPNNAVISDDNIMRFTEELFEKQDQNINQYVEWNLQKRVTGNSEGSTVADESPEPLLILKPELDTIPTISSLRALYKNYNRDGTQKEVMTPERRNEENAFLDEIVKTPVMKRALDWLVEKKLVESDDYEQKDLLKRMWFNNFDGTSSGFERIFLSEKFGDSGLVGMQNWIYFAHLESQKNVNYLSYVDTISLSGKGSLLKMNYQSEGFTMQNATIFVGTPPELELALYTVCFHVRPNNWCPVSLGGAKFFILTHSFRYFGKDLIDLGFPSF